MNYIKIEIPSTKPSMNVYWRSSGNHSSKINFEARGPTTWNRLRRDQITGSFLSYEGFQTLSYRQWLNIKNFKRDFRLYPIDNESPLKILSKEVAQFIFSIQNKLSGKRYELANQRKIQMSHTSKKISPSLIIKETQTETSDILFFTDDVGKDKSNR